MRVTRRSVLAGAALAATGIAGCRLGVDGQPDRELPRKERSAYPMRGANIPSRATDADLRALAATGANLVRISCPATPLRTLTPPYAIDDRSFRRLDEIIASCKRYRLKAIIDPHAFPGMRSKYTCSPDDELWRQRRFQDLAVELWGYIADRYRDAGDVIVGYDLLNEPAVPDVSANTGLASWNALARRMAAAVRAHDARRYLIIEPAVGSGPSGGWYDRFTAMSYLTPPPGERVVVSPHMYAPHAFTLQGVKDHPTGVSYPGGIDGEHWDKARLSHHMTPARIYQETHGVPVLVGEFGVARWTGAAGVQYLRDNIELYESWGWSWAYLAWREYEGWDPEMSSDPASTRRHASTPRLELLRRYFARNESSVAGF